MKSTIDSRRFRTYFLIFVLFVSIFGLTPILFSNIGFKQTLKAEDSRIVRIPLNFDSNNNKIHDAFEDSINFASIEPVEAIICFERVPNESDRKMIEALGGTWIQQFQVIYAAQISIPAYKIEQLAKEYAISAISANSKAKSFLYLSNNQIRARNATWNLQFNGLNLTGNPYFSTAVLDTGIDATHPDLASRIIAWKDFAGADAMVSGDEYLTPTDYGHHGTHVAGIVSGQGNSSKTNYMNVTQAGLIQTTLNYVSYGPSFIKTGSDSRSLIIKQSWNTTFDSWVGIIKTDGSISPGSISNNSEWSATISVPGHYSTLVGGNDQANINYDIPYVAQVAFPIQDPTDGYGANTGIAPESKIVALKVLDDTGSGTKSQLLNALDWCINNKTTFNITVINLSLGFDNIESDIDTAIENVVKNHGIVVVAAAGNDGVSSTKICSPGSAPYAITVGAVNQVNEIAYYSSIGNPIYNNIVVKPDVTAPGGSVYSYPYSSLKTSHTIFSADSNYDDEFEGNYGPDGWIDGKNPSDRYPDDYTGMQGTSMATPHVSGVAQLIIQRLAADNGGVWTWSGTNAAKVKQLLLMATSESKALGMGGEDTQNPQLNRGTKDYTEGWGRIDTLSAIDLATEISSFTSKNLTFSNSSIGPRVAAYNLKLNQSIQYSFILRMLDNRSDIDLFLYQGTPSTFGEPIQLNKSATVGLGVDEFLTYTPNATGTYYLIARWANGTGTSNAILTTPTINDALDNDDIQFTTGGDAPWIYQTNETYDGIDAMRSGIINNSQSSWISTTLNGPGNISFYWKVDSELNNDWINFSVNGVSVGGKSGNNNWTKFSYSIPNGTHTLVWNYSKDAATSSGNDCAWLDLVTYEINIEEHRSIISEINPNPSTTGIISLSWTPIIGAIKYYLFRQPEAFDNVSSLTPIAEPTTIFYTDNITINGTYFYRVLATNGTHNSTLSNIINVTVAIPPIQNGSNTEPAPQPEPEPEPEPDYEIPFENLVYGAIALGVVVIILSCAFRKPKKMPTENYSYYN
jgi:subtilisin family serine protease